MYKFNKNNICIMVLIQLAVNIMSVGEESAENSNFLF